MPRSLEWDYFYLDLFIFLTPLPLLQEIIKIVPERWLSTTSETMNQIVDLKLPPPPPTPPKKVHLLNDPLLKKETSERPCWL